MISSSINLNNVIVVPTGQASATNFKVANGTDLNTIFAPIVSGTTQASATNFKVANGADLNTIFAPIVSGTTQASATNFKVNGNDLCTIFNKKI